MADTVDQETLEFQASRRPRLVWAALVVLVVVVVPFAVVDHRRGTVESRALDRCAGPAISAVDRANSHLKAVADYIAPAVDPPRVDPLSGLQSLLSEEAATSTPAVEDAAARCTAVTVWPWHRRHREARQAYADLLTAALDRLARIADDGGAYYRGADEVHRLRAAAETAWPVRLSSSP